jgi:hypothetical protein
MPYRHSLHSFTVALLVVVKQAEDVILGKSIAALEEVKLNGERQPGDLAA